MVVYFLRFFAPQNRTSGQAVDTWLELKKRLLENHPNFWFEKAIRKLGDPQWRTEYDVPEVLHADLVPIDRAEGGIGNPDGPQLRFEGTGYFAGIWNDIVFVFDGRGWTPELVLPYKIALAKVVREEVGYEFDCALERTGMYAYCRKY